MGPLTGTIAAGAVASPASSIGWVPLLVVLLSSGVVSALVAVVAASSGVAAENRRQGYAAAVEAVVAWAEYPFRIRRRTSDDPATLSDLANLGHELQERGPVVPPRASSGSRGLRLALVGAVQRGHLPGRVEPVQQRIADDPE